MTKRWLLVLLALALILNACSVGTGERAHAPTATSPSAHAQAGPTNPPGAESPAPIDTSAPAPTDTRPSEDKPAPTDTAQPTAEPNATTAPDPTDTAEPTTPPEETNTPEPTPTEAPTSAKPVARYVDTEGYGKANLRQRPTTDSAILLSIPYGAQVRAQGAAVTGADGAPWYEVTYEGKTGYVRGSLLSQRRPAARPTAIAERPNPPRRVSSRDGDTWTLTAVGDIMLSRSVLRKMKAYGSYRHPYLKTAELLRAADFTVANLEGQVSDNVAPSRDPHTFSFISPTAVLDGVRWSGIDAVSLANNHTLDFGTRALSDTMEALDEYDIGHFGAGRTRASSYTPRIFIINGQRVAFVGFTDLSNVGFPDPSLPTGAPAYSAERVAEVVREAREQADVVIPYFHWGVEYVSVPNSRQRSLAHAAIDAGADLVIGAHAHWVQETERYRGKPIVYSLGNFVFDQMWSRETRQGVVATFTFRGSEVVNTRYTPILIEDFNQPRIATGSDYDAVIERMGLRD